ncbi:hypothetical protein [Corynebacterium pygosceleis]|uniref:hypothetical protein n=1 Tax=Corynebacterium pygosceleis TaxID=2800406 RepID=UPI00190595CF|nr:hypothetical protein [Corynebacterium pygosceleis]MCK7675865.1 hypothetical protein [Corynebacterium pygosceleis]MCL0120753.1 hypothetical protein [Corynebacterium pygosceleis]
MILRTVVALTGTAAIFFVFLGVLQDWDMNSAAKSIFALLFSAVFAYLIFRDHRKRRSQVPGRTAPAPH